MTVYRYLQSKVDELQHSRDTKKRLSAKKIQDRLNFA